MYKISFTIMYLRGVRVSLANVRLSQRAKFCSVNVETTSTENNEEVTEEKIKIDEEIEKLRDVSRLPAKLKGRMKHILQPHPHEVQPDLITQLKRKKKFNNLLYASYGRRSAIDPSYFWMNEEDLKEQIEFEKEWEPSLHEKLRLLKEQEESLKQEMWEK